MRKWWFGWMASMVVLAACAQPPAAEPAACAGARVIVKLQGGNDPAASAVVAALSATAGAPLVYQRTLSTGAALYCLQGVEDAARIDEAVQRLHRRGDVEYAELDRRVRPLPRPEVVP